MIKRNQVGVGWYTACLYACICVQSNGETGVYFARFKPPRAGEAGGVASGTAAYHTFDYGMLHVIILDSGKQLSNHTAIYILFKRVCLCV